MNRLIGREAERRELIAALDRAHRFAAPQFLTILGSAGIGKTRLLSDWLQEVREQRHFRTVCVSAKAEGVSSAGPAFGVVRALLTAHLGIEKDMQPVDVAERLREELSIVFGERRVSEIAGLLGKFLGLTPSQGTLMRSLAMRPEQEDDLARAVLCRFVEEAARQKPTVYVVDDADRADDSSLDLLARLRGDLGEAPLVIVVAAGPELLVRRPDWGAAIGSHMRLDLRGLAPLEMDVFIQCALGAKTLAPGLAERAAIESGGNPSLLSELLCAYHEDGILACDTADAWHFDAERAESQGRFLGSDMNPATRVAELGPAERSILGRAAAMGEVFWLGGVVALGRLGADPWDPTLVFAPDPCIEECKRLIGNLAERGYIKKAASGFMGDGMAWAFCDRDERALIEATVDPQLMARRRGFAAQWIEARTGKTPSVEQLEGVAALYRLAGDDRRASHRFLAAADAACQTHDFERARSLYARGLGLLGSDDVLLRIETLHKLGDVCARLGHSHEALAHFGDMLRAAWTLDLPGKGGAAHARIGRVYRGLGDYRMAVQHLDMAHLLFDLGGDRPGVAASLDDIGRVYYLVGKPEDALRCHRAALAIRVELKDERGMALTLAWIGLVEALMGRLEPAQRNFERALSISQSTRDPHGIVFTLLDLAALTREAGNPQLAQKLLAQARGVSGEMGDRLTECHLALQVGDCLLAQGDYQAAEKELRAAKDIAQKLAARRLVAEADRGLAEACLARKDWLGARDFATEAVAQAEKMGAAPLVGTALRILGLALAAGAPGDCDRGGAREVFDRAIELLGSSGAELELGRTFVAYADFEEGIGRREAAAQLRDRARRIRRVAGLMAPERDLEGASETFLQ